VIKKIYILFLIVLFFCAAVAAPSNRPYNHWKIVYLANDEWEEKTVYIDRQEIGDALDQFKKQTGGAEIRCIARDYYYLCNPRQGENL
jgi:hypothetical protein